MTQSTVSLADLEMSVDALDPVKAAAIYQEHGCLVVRGLMSQYAETIRDDILYRVNQAIELYNQGKYREESVGRVTPDGSLFIPAPEGFERDYQIMTVSCSYLSSSAFFRSAFDENAVAIVKAIHGENVELFLNGQVLCKEAAGGHPKLLHQDASYFEHKYEGPAAALCYTVPTDVNRGALHVVPGSHRFEVLDHVDTESHLGLDPRTWTFDKALPVEGDAGDAIFFHVKTIHGSPPNFADAPRPVFIHRYSSSDDYVVIIATDAEAREQRKAEVEQAKKENQRGFMVSGFRPYEIRE